MDVMAVIAHDNNFKHAEIALKLCFGRFKLPFLEKSLRVRDIFPHC